MRLQDKADDLVNRASLPSPALGVVFIYSEITKELHLSAFTLLRQPRCYNGARNGWGEDIVFASI